MRRRSAFAVSLIAAALAQQAGAVVAYLSQSRKLTLQLTTLPPFSTTLTSTDAGFFVRDRSIQRLARWNDLTYTLAASANINSNISPSGISASGFLAAVGAPFAPSPLQGPISSARIEIAASFSVDIETPFNLVASTLPLRANDLFSLELKTVNGNDIVHIDHPSFDTLIAFSGILSPGEYSFHYLAELNSGSYLGTDYSVNLAIPAPGSFLFACVLAPAARRRLRPPAPAALA